MRFHAAAEKSRGGSMPSGRPLLASLTGVLLLLMGVLRVLAGLSLLLQAPRAVPGVVALPESIRSVALSLAGIGLIVVLAGLSVLRRWRWSWGSAQASLVIFVAGGFLCSRCLFGSARLVATIGDILVALIVSAALARAQRGEGDGEDE
jgi:hypothetical protein